MEENKTNIQGNQPIDTSDAENLSTEDQLMSNLHKISFALRHHTGSRGGQGRILSVLAKRGGAISQGELMDIVCVRSGSLSEVLGKLEQAGYITRSPNEEDRRKSDIRLTREGETAAQARDEGRCEKRKALFDVLSEEEKVQLNQLLDKLGAGLDPQEVPCHKHGKHGHHNCEKHGHGGQGCGRHGHGGEGQGHHGHHHHHEQRGHHHHHSRYKG